MSDTDKRETGRRWYDASRMVIVLFSIVGFFVIGWGGLVFSMAMGATSKNVMQDEQIKAINDRLSDVDRKLDRQDVKLDRIFEKVK